MCAQSKWGFGAWIAPHCWTETVWADTQGRAAAAPGPCLVPGLDRESEVRRGRCHGQSDGHRALPDAALPRRALPVLLVCPPGRISERARANVASSLMLWLQIFNSGLGRKEQGMENKLEF